MLSEEQFQQLLRNQQEANLPIGVGEFRVPLSVRPKQNKYRVAPKAERTVGLLTFASKAEATAYQTLLLLQQAGEVTKIELQPEFPFPMKYKYVADFRVTYATGEVAVIDVKGVETPVFRLKMKDMAYFYPEVKVLLWK